MQKRQTVLGSHHRWYRLIPFIFAAAMVSQLNACGAANTGRSTTPATVTQTSTQTLAHHTVYVSADSGILRALNADTGQLRWQRKTDEKAAGKPVIENGIVYTSSQRTVYAFKASDGTPLWSARGYSPDTGPVVADGKVFVDYYTSQPDNKVSVSVAALKGTDGSQLWSKQVVTQFTSSSLSISTPGTSGQLVANGVFYTAVLSDQFHLYALNVNNGDLLWQSSSAFTDGQKTLLFVENAVVYAYLDRLYAYRASDGKRLWQSQGAGQELYRVSTGLLVDPGPKGTVYIHTFMNGLMAYRIANGSLLWHVPENKSPGYVVDMTLVNGVLYATQHFGVSALDAHTGKPLWIYKTNPQDWSFSEFLGPLTDRSSLYINSFASGLAALDIHTGHLRWRTGVGGNGIIPTLLDGTLFLGDGQGVITAVRATDGGVLWRFPTNYGMSFPSAVTVV